MHGNHIESWQSWRRGGRARASESHSMADDLVSLPSHPNSMLLQHDPDDGLPGYGGGSPTWSRRRAGDAMNRWLCACACWMPSPRACSPMWSPQVFCRFPARPAAATPPGRGCVGGGGGGAPRPARHPKSGSRPPRRSLYASIDERGGPKLLVLPVQVKTRLRERSIWIY
jgi:hypothetical protein